jgi:hypothetical protein
MSEKSAREQNVRETSKLEERLLFVMNDKDDPGLSPIDNQRRRYARMLGEIGEYFVKIGRDNLPELGIYIASLGVALEDLIDGVTDSLFKTKGPKRKGSKRDSRRIWGARFQATLGLECLIISGLSRNAAAQQAARDYKGLERLLRGERRDLKRSLLSWYDRYAEGLVPVPQLLEHFQTVRHTIRSANVSTAEYRRWGQSCFELAVKWASR